MKVVDLTQLLDIALNCDHTVKRYEILSIDISEGIVHLTFKDLLTGSTHDRLAVSHAGFNMSDMACTDGDRNQYGKKLCDGHYQFMEYNEQEKEWVEMDILLSQYTEEQIDNHISAYYNSVQHIKELYEDSWEWIIAECIFEQESGLY